MNNLMSVQDVATYIGRSKDFVYDHADELGGIKLGNRFRFRLSDVDKYIEKNRLSPRRHASS